MLNVFAIFQVVNARLSRPIQLDFRQVLVIDLVTGRLKLFWCPLSLNLFLLLDCNRIRRHLLELKWSTRLLRLLFAAASHHVMLEHLYGGLVVIVLVGVLWVLIGLIRFDGCAHCATRADVSVNTTEIDLKILDGGGGYQFKLLAGGLGKLPPCITAVAVVIGSATELIISVVDRVGVPLALRSLLFYGSGLYLAQRQLRLVPVIRHQSQIQNCTIVYYVIDVRVGRRRVSLWPATFISSPRVE